MVRNGTVIFLCCPLLCFLQVLLPLAEMFSHKTVRNWKTQSPLEACSLQAALGVGGQDWIPSLITTIDISSVSPL